MALSLILFAGGFMVTLVVGVGFMLTVMSGNLKAMQFLAKNGLALFCGDIDTDYKLLRYVNQDSIGWIKIPNNCYLPIMGYTGGKYKDHNFLQKENNYGEVYVSESQNSINLSKIALPSKNDDFVLKDLSILDGSSRGISNNMRKANFSNLRGLEGNTEEIEIIDNGHLRKFKVLGIVEQCVGDLASFKFSNRDEFLSGLLDKAFYKSRYSYKDIDVIILRSKSDILNLLVLLIEVN